MRTTQQWRWMMAAVTALVGVPALAGCRTFVPIAVEAERRASVGTLLDATSAAATALPASGSLDDYVAFALRRNAGLRSAAAHWDAAMHRIGPATAPPDPQLQYAGFLEPIETRTGPQRNRLALMQKLPWPGKLAERGEVAAAEAEVRWFGVQRTRRAVARNVGRHWFESAYLDRAMVIAQAHLAILQGLEAVVQRRIQAGGRQDDLLRLQVEIGRVDDDLARLRAKRPAVLAQLAAVVDLQSAAGLPAPVLASPKVHVPDIGLLLARLEDGNPELAALQGRIRKSQHQLELAKLAAIPDLTVGALWIDTGSARIPNQRDSGDDPFALTLGVNVPIWVGKYAGRWRAAEADRLAAESARHDRSNGLGAELTLQRFRLDDAARQIKLYRDTLLPRAEQSLTLAETAYRAGSSDLLSVIDSQRTLLNFQRARWRAIADYGRAEIDIEALIGKDTK